MKLNLNRPICFFDLETTGTNVATDRIVEMAILKVYPNGNTESKSWLINPEIPIPAEVTAIHGITDEQVAGEPTFKDRSREIQQIIQGCDLAGFNSNRFDIPLLAEELLRADLDFDMKSTVAVDVQTIFHKMEKRTLEAAYQFYCGKTLIDAHSAVADTRATYEVLLAQLKRYPDLENDVKSLATFSTHSEFVDFAGFIRKDKSGAPVFGFGKHKGRKVTEVLEGEPGYFGWLLNADFPRYTKKVLTQIRLAALNSKL
jgi:DNA polymerase-3 subunit epsilon